MKKLLLLLICSIFLMAQDVDKKKYEEAFNAYSSKDYKLAFELFDALFFEHMDHLKINYYLAKSAEQLKDYDTAIGAYERILILRPDSAKIHLALANIYMKLAIWPQALSELNKATKLNMPEQLKVRIEDTIKILREREKATIHSFFALTGFMYDSNINNTADIANFTIFSPDLNTMIDVNQGAEEEGATIFQVLGIYNNKYKFTKDFILDSTLNLYHQKYINHKDKDIHLASLSIKPTYFAKSYAFAMNFSFDKFNLGHKSYQENFYIKPQVTFSLAKQAILTTGVTYGNINYEEVNKLRDYDSFTSHNSLKYIFEEAGLLQVDVDIGKDNEVHDTRTDVEKWHYLTKVFHSYNVYEDYVLNSVVSYKLTKYNDRDVNFESKREDHRYIGSLGVQKELNKHITMTVGVDYTKNDSNHSPSTYDKYTVKTNFFIKF